MRELCDCFEFPSGTVAVVVQLVLCENTIYTQLPLLHYATCARLKSVDESCITNYPWDHGRRLQTAAAAVQANVGSLVYGVKIFL